MDLADTLSGGKRQDEQAVIICLQFPTGKLHDKKALNAVFNLDTILREMVNESDVGFYEGHEFYKGYGEECVTFFIYGEDASRIYQELKPVLQFLHRLQRFSVIKCYARCLNNQ